MVRCRSLKPRIDGKLLFECWLTKTCAVADSNALFASVVLIYRFIINVLLRNRFVVCNPGKPCRNSRFGLRYEGSNRRLAFEYGKSRCSAHQRIRRPPLLRHEVHGLLGFSGREAIAHWVLGLRSWWSITPNIKSSLWQPRKGGLGSGSGAVVDTRARGRICIARNARQLGGDHPLNEDLGV